MTNPFVHHTPSVFVVCSPFQVLCAVAAIRQLEIGDYKFILALRNKDHRRYQTINLVESFSIKYEIKHVNIIKKIVKRIVASIPRKFGYKRIFIGDYRNEAELYYGAQYIRNGADATIAVRPVPWEEAPRFGIMNTDTENRIIEFEEKPKNIINFLTIYTDITNPKYNIEELSLYSIFSPQGKRPEKDVIVVGTNAVIYCKGRGISERALTAKQRELIKQLTKEYPDEQIVYIPHGKDKSEYAQQLCQEYGCEFRRTDLPIEMELVHQPFALLTAEFKSLFDVNFVCC